MGFGATGGFSQTEVLIQCTETVVALVVQGQSQTEQLENPTVTTSVSP